MPHSTESTPPTTPPRPGHYWQYDEGRGWHEVRPLNWFWLLKHAQQRRAARGH